MSRKKGKRRERCWWVEALDTHTHNSISTELDIAERFMHKRSEWRSDIKVWSVTELELFRLKASKEDKHLKFQTFTSLEGDELIRHLREREAEGLETRYRMSLYGQLPARVQGPVAEARASVHRLKPRHGSQTRLPKGFTGRVLEFPSGDSVAHIPCS